MSEINDGGPVHPGSTFNEEGFVSGYHPGMSLRDWFAGQALTGVLANPATSGPWPSEASALIYEVADAMLAARAAKKEAE